MKRRVIQVDEKVPFLQGLPLSLQHLFAMFGASILVPSLFNAAAQKATGIANIQVIDPGLVLLLNGIGTLIYLLICKGKAPAYLGSSFAFIAPASAVISTGATFAQDGSLTKAITEGVAKTNFSHALGGFIAAGLVFSAVALLIKFVGTKWIDVILPPAAMGPIVALIGLELAGTATSMAFSPVKSGVINIDQKTAVIIALFTLVVLVLGNLVFRGYLAVVPVLIAILAGYALSAVINIFHPGIIDYSLITNKSVLSLPQHVFPSFNWKAITIIIPAALVVMSEHIGHLFVTGKIIERDLVKDPGLHRSLLGDGLSTIISGFTGSVPTTTYGENMGVMAITRVYSVWVIGGAAIISIIMAFFGNFSGAISSIPSPVMGGVCMLLFGVIAASGIRMIVEAKVDYSKSRNLVLTAIVFIVGISGVKFNLGGGVELKGMALATIIGMGVSLVFYILDILNLTNDGDASEAHPDLSSEPVGKIVNK